MHMRGKTLIIAYYIIAIPVLFLCLFLIYTNQAVIYYHGFAVDAEQNIYIGQDREIAVYSDSGQYLRSFSSMTSRDYSFYITDENIIVVLTGENCYQMDTSGQILSEQPVQTESKSTHRTVQSPDGTEYIMKSPLLRTEIYRKDGAELVSVYRMPLPDYAVKLFICLFFLSICPMTLQLILMSKHSTLKDLFRIIR